MIQLSVEQLNNLGKEALVIIASSLQDQLIAMQKQRQLVLQDKVDAYFEWVKLKYSQVTHNSVIGRALTYSINQEECLRMFLTDGRIPTDNNYAEQAIRPFTIARKKLCLNGIR